MSLGDLNENLYKNESEEEKRQHEESSFDPFHGTHDDPKILSREKGWNIKEDGMDPEKKKAIKKGIIIAGSLIVIIGGFFGFIKYRQSLFSEERTAVAISGLENVNSAETITYKIRYKNSNKVDLKEAEILLNYPENFRPEKSDILQIENDSNARISAGTIKAGSEGDFEIKGKFYAPKDYQVFINATLEYKPSNISSSFKAEIRKAITVRTSPLLLEVTAPLEAASGNNVEYVIDYRNQGDTYMPDLKIKAQYPDGFTFSSSDPAASEGDNFWYLGSLEVGKSGKIKISGILEGNKDDGKIIKIQLGSTTAESGFTAFNTKEITTKIVGSPLFIEQTVNGQKSPFINAGENLRYAISFRNNSNIALRNVIITLEIDSPVLDFARLDLREGSYDSKKKMITWKASDIPELGNLSPGVKGELTFSIPVLDRIPVASENDKNFTVVSVAKIDSPDVPTPIASNKVVSSDKMDMRLNSKVIFESFGIYADKNIKNSGPNPPQVGAESTYAIHWKVTNVSNDVSNVRVSSSIPSGVKWTGKFYPENENVTYDERSSQVVWMIGGLKNGVGIIEPPRELTFQISLMPEANQLGQSVQILNPSVVKAKDGFTGNDIMAEKKQLTIRDIIDGGDKVEPKTEM